MALTNLKLQKFAQALATLEEVVVKDLADPIIRDSAIQRFEYTIEIFWKSLKTLLNEQFGLDANSPKTVIRESTGQALITPAEAETLLVMLDLRNQTSHDYTRKIAQELAQHLPAYTQLLRKVLESTEALLRQ